METPPIAKLKAEVFARFPGTQNGGTYNCRPIKGSTTWSQHAWGNALDIMVPDLATGDRVYAWVSLNRARFGTGTALWRVKDHFDHIHVEGLPKQKGDPPCATGTPRQPAPGGAGVGGTTERAGDPVSLLEAGATLLRAETWIRVGLFAGGGILIGGGLILLSQELGAPGLKEIANLIPAGKLAGTVADVVT